MQPTDEQLAIIHHPLGQHARVLAVAGSGKTTTMVYRIKYLVEELHQDPARVRVVMFNRLAREQFEQKLAEEIFEPGKRPTVLTFHGLAYRLHKDAEKLELMPQYKQLWSGDREELALIFMHRAIQKLQSDGVIDRETDIDPAEALDTVGLWKASLIPPERAGHRTNPELADVYRYFEYLREKEHALTFDDFVPKAMELLESNSVFRQRWRNRLEHLIVDEYQDINYGQQQLIRLLAGDRADVMVVGDDDQTIYEWRAARPHYILKGFQEDFTNKPIVDYTLSHSFRFGPLIAQTAYNVVTFNQQRAIKPLVAHDVQKSTGITILTGNLSQSTNVVLEMAQEMATLLRQGISLGKIGVLGRTYSQLVELQAVCIERKLPFAVIGSVPFFESDENRTLIDYIRLALAWNHPASTLVSFHRQDIARDDQEESAQEKDVTHYKSFMSFQGSCAEATRVVLAVANTPKRKLSRAALQQAVESGHKRGLTLGASLEELLDPDKTILREERRELLQDLVDFLYLIREWIMGKPDLQAGELLNRVVGGLKYYDHFSDYYGEGIPSQSRIDSVKSFLQFAQATGMNITTFMEHLKTLDTLQGFPKDHVLKMTTIHRTKGLEYDYVFIPNCLEGYMPTTIQNEVAIYDKEGIVPEIIASPPIENERRLFYVAITRAKEHLYIGTRVASKADSQGQMEFPSRFLEEMQHQNSAILISTAQEITTCPSDNDRRSLIRKIFQHEGYPRVLLTCVFENYIKPYVRNLNEHNWIDRMLAETPDTLFKYTYAYQGLVSRLHQQQKDTRRDEKIMRTILDTIDL